MYSLILESASDSLKAEKATFDSNKPLGKIVKVIELKYHKKSMGNAYMRSKNCLMWRSDMALRNCTRCFESGYIPAAGTVLKISPSN